MSEYVIMPKADYVSACNKIREKTQKTDLIKSGDLVQTFEEIIPTSEEKTIAPDFSGGNMEVTPDDGAMFSKVTVQKPENLLPENIAGGVNIAGIIGTLAAGGSVEENLDFKFSQTGETLTYSMSVNKTITTSVTIPSGAKIRMVLMGGRLKYSTGTTDSAIPPVTSVSRISNYSVSGDTVSASYNGGTKPTRQYGGISMCLIVIYAL